MANERMNERINKLHDKREEIFKRGMNYWYDELMN